MDFLCSEYGMGRPAEGYENFVIMSFNKLRDNIVEIGNLDDTIENAIWKLKQLRSKRSELRVGILKELKKCKRVYVPELFKAFNDSVERVVKLMCSDFPIRSTSLVWIMKQVLVLREKTTSKKAIATMAKSKEIGRGKGRIKANYGSNVRLIRKEEVDKADRDDEFKCYPVWHKDSPETIEIRSSENETENFALKVYDPGYYPNPFADFMEKYT